MKWLVAFAWTVFIVVIVIFAFPTLRLSLVDAISYSKCDNPLEYKLGSIDDRFNLSREQALKNIQDGANIWSNVRGKPLFTNSDDAKLTINFIYDQRQALNTKINELNSQVSQKNAALKQQVDQYRSDSADFERRLNEFMNTVNKYNNEGGAPEDKYDELMRQQSQLKSEAESLNARAKQLNISTSDYNENVSVLNSDINEFKKVLKVKPEEGLYDGASNTITIYFVDNQAELVHTLGHEFGHALGINHVNDANAIMYPNTTNTLVPTAGDITQLNFVCREQSAPIHWARMFNEFVYDNIKNLKN